jgi:signal transduction histidine kinase
VTLLDIATLIVYVAGAVLHVVLFYEVLRRPRKRRSEVLLMFLGLAAGMWFLGNTLSKLGEVLFVRGSPLLGMTSDVIRSIGIGFVPSLLIHMAFLFFVEIGMKVGRRARYVAVALFYVPAVGFSYALLPVLAGEQKLVQLGTTFTGKLFTVWLAVALAVSAGIALEQSRRAEDDYERRFHRLLFVGLLLLAAGIAAVDVLAGRRLAEISEDVVSTLDLLINAGSLLPAIVFSYYVYRYNLMEFVLRRSILHGVLTIILIALYYYGIRRFGHFLNDWTRDKAFKLNVALVEALLIIPLFYLFPRLTDLVRRLMVKAAFRQMAGSEKALEKLNREVGERMALDAAALVRHTAARVQEATGARHVTVLLMEPSAGTPLRLPAVTTARRSRGVAPAHAPDVRAEDAAPILDYFRAGTVRFLDRHECTDVPCANQMRLWNTEWAFPLRTHSRVWGLLCVGRSPGGFPLDPEVCDLLVQTAARLAGALEHARLIQERVGLHFQMLESEKFASLGRLSASIAHEVKNPLSSIKVLAQLLQEQSPPDSPDRGDLQLIIDEVDRLARVVNQLLRFARPPRHETAHCRLGPVLEMVLQVVQPEANAAGVTVQASPTADLPPLAVPEDSLKEAVFNLVYNAIQAMPDGGRLTLTAENSPRGALLRIADTGPGIPPELREKVFEPFFTTKVSGTGLGLSIAKRRIEEVGGEIRLEPSPEGTTFAIELPVAPETLETAQPPEAPAD